MVARKGSGHGKRLTAGLGRDTIGFGQAYLWTDGEIELPPAVCSLGRTPVPTSGERAISISPSVEDSAVEIRSVNVTRSIFVVAVVAAAAGCESVGASMDATVRDSAGIEIVESSRPRWRTGEEWRLSNVASVSIGAVFGDDPATQFTRIVGATRLRDGRIVVADGATAELRYFGATGAHLKTVGGRGGGPGEFARISRILRRPGDSVIAIQSVPPRQSLFSDTGGFVRLVPVPTIGQFLPLVYTTILDDGTAILAPGARPLTMLTGTRTESTTYHAIAPGSDSTHVLGTFPFIELAGNGSRVGLVRFAPTGVSAAHGDRFYVGFPERFEIAAYSSQGTLRRLIRRAWVPRPVSGEERDALLERQYADAAAEVRNAVVFAETHPAYDQLLVDATGALWVRAPRTDGGSNFRPADLATWAQRWSIFDEEGVWLGDITLPAGFDLLEVGDDYALGVWYNEDDIPFVRVYRLTKG